jgi:hypothetical protein
MNTFEAYLMEKFYETNQQVLDDDGPDAFDSWLSEEMDIDSLIKYGNKYGELMFHKGKNKILNNIKKDLI